MSHAAMSILQKICNNIIHPSMSIMPPGIQGAMIIFSWFSPRSSKYHTPPSFPQSYTRGSWHCYLELLDQTALNLRTTGTKKNDDGCHRDQCKASHEWLETEPHVHQTALTSVPVPRESRVVELVCKARFPGLQVEDEFRVILKFQVNLNSRRLSPTKWAMKWNWGLQQLPQPSSQSLRWSLKTVVGGFFPVETWKVWKIKISRYGHLDVTQGNVSLLSNHSEQLTQTCSNLSRSDSPV